MRNRRCFFENYALLNHFDALTPDNWYHQTMDRIMANEVTQIEEEDNLKMIINAIHRMHLK